MNKYFFRKLKSKIGWVLKTRYFTRKFIINYITRKNADTFNELLDYIETAEKVLIGSCDLKLGIVKDEDKLSLSINTYWPKFERFAKNNKIKYSFLNIHENNWIEECKNYDLIVWSPPTDPASLYEVRTKIFYIEKLLQIQCYPSYKGLWTYEDKIRLFYHLDVFALPVIPTFISFDEQECLRKIDSLEYPLISKSYVGASSLSVCKLNNKAEARSFILKAFSRGLDTGFPFFRQKGYVFFQKFIVDNYYDLRVIIVGPKIFGYYRMKPKNDFRASGAGLVVKDELPLDAVLLALKVKEAIPGPMLAVDFLKSEKENKFYIIEASINIDIGTPEQLVVNNIPGYYLLKDGSLEFHQGKYWLQELLLEEVIKHIKSEVKKVQG